MNSAFVGYEELGRSRRVLSASVDNTLLDLPNSSYPTKAEFIQLLHNSPGAWNKLTMVTQHAIRESEIPRR